jgi:UDP-N-acetylmuramoylalanine--D-glutamate ligase
MNAACAAAAAWCAGASGDAIERALAEFRPLPHRLETVGTIDGVRFVEDSVSTTPEASIAALRSFPSPIHLIAGGSSKGTHFAEMGRAVAEHATTAALIGEMAAEIASAITVASPAGTGVFCCSTLAEAFNVARRAAHPGDVVLLSPGCASFDMFRNYEDRAEQFRRLVREAALRQP